MIFTAPWVLFALLGLPVIWWLIRMTPPAPRSQDFPAIRFLMGLHTTEETPARTPAWLLLLRLLAAALVIVGLARPVLDAGSALPGNGPLLLVIDNGWASAPGWDLRKKASTAILDQAERSGRRAALLATATNGDGAPIAVTATMPIADLRQRLEALQPEAWPPDRAAAARALTAWHERKDASVAYLPDGLTDGPDFSDFAAALRNVGDVTEIGLEMPPVPLLLSPNAEADRLVVHVARVPDDAPLHAIVLGQSGDGRTLARSDIIIPPDATTGSGAMTLPPELRNRLTRLVLEGPPSAGSVMLLDERSRRRPVGLLTGDLTTADTPFIGAFYFVRRALSPFFEVRDGTSTALLSRDISVLLMADQPQLPGSQQEALTNWVKHGGLLIRFAGPRTAEAAGNETDPLLPVTLLANGRQLGGAMSWSQPAGLAPFAPESPFSGLTAAEEVKVERQVLAEPSSSLAAHTWATLRDGTPLVTEKALGAGRVVLFHVTANADWSNLPLSGLFVEMLRRLVAISVGVATPADKTVLAPYQTVDGFGVLNQPPPSATGLAADQFSRSPVSAQNPPGLYGPEESRQVLNLGTALSPLQAAPPIDGAKLQTLSGIGQERALAPALIGGATALLLVDMFISLAMRGFFRARLGAAGLALVILCAPAARALEPPPNPATATQLGYILSGDEHVDRIAEAGLEALTTYVNRRTAAALHRPDPIRPGETDLSPYPLVYWPITASTQNLTSDQAAALNTYMEHGGIILIDTRGGGSGEGFAPGSAEAFRRIGQALHIPPLTPLNDQHVLSRAFYLLSDFPGRFTGESVWVQRDSDPTNDSVSPVVIGGNDWAAAWVENQDGSSPYAVIPGGERQRTMAYRFGVNLVMYALTGNYKGDQVHIPAILRRLGQ